MKSLVALLVIAIVAIVGVVMIRKGNRAGWLLMAIVLIMLVAGVIYRQRDAITTMIAQRGNADVQNPFTPSEPEVADLTRAWQSFRGGPKQAHALSAKKLGDVSWESPRWKYSFSGTGLSSPSVANNRIVLTQTDEQQQTNQLVTIDFDAGEEMAVVDLPFGNPGPIHANNSYATVTPAVDSDHSYAVSVVDRSVYLTSVNLSGEQAWSCEIGTYWTQHGIGSSPCLYRGLVICAVEGLDAPFAVAVDAASGKIVWRKRLRPSQWNFGTPVVASLCERDQLLLATHKEVLSMNPLTGSEYWSCAWSADRAANCVVASPTHVFASSTSPESEIICIRGDGNGDVTESHLVWQQERGAGYVVSPVLVSQGLLTITDDGIAHLLNVETGDVIDRMRLGGDVFSSPICLDNQVLAIDHEGVLSVLEVVEDKITRLSRFDLGEPTKSTPAVWNDRLFVRSEKTLWCWELDKPPTPESTTAAIGKSQE
ncbi:PQQ-binding-like beta-propeller repeat protein [Planctomycetes bacterium K23_9]|uniref:Outer membrane protein assembly factor BamB n=1 Tax=Stieleria marina TaxID=1930275 RepID=A0A517NNN1_9BACT|nr:Outer membrane protein assembly factor BamB [Planctomycetes bacterium K23_9]